MLMATINSSIVLIALPDIFRGIHIDPLAPGNTSYLLWLILGFLVVMAVLLVSLGRLGDIYGRVRMFNLGFAVFTLFSILLSVTWLQGSEAALWLIVMRIGQGVGGALLFANSNAILTDAFPREPARPRARRQQHRRDRGLVPRPRASAACSRRCRGGSCSSSRCRSASSRRRGPTTRCARSAIARAARIDWWGNVTFALGLVGVMIGITYGIQPYGGHTMGWTSPFVLTMLLGGTALLIAFCVIETHVDDPMFHIDLFRIRAFTAGNVAALLAAMGRGGLQFILIIWLQGIWLPEHGYAFDRTPLWAGIYMLPLIAGFLVAGPASGWLSDHFGARPFATGGMLLAALSFALLIVLPVDFAYAWFAAILLLNGIGMGLFASPNSAGVMNALPPAQRGAGAGHAGDVHELRQRALDRRVLHADDRRARRPRLPHTMQTGLVAHGVPAADAARVSQLPPVATLFASLPRLQPDGDAARPATCLHGLPQGQAAELTGRSFFPHLISGPFHTALVYAFVFAIVACLIAAVASLLRGAQVPSRRDAAARRRGADARATSRSSHDGGDRRSDVPDRRGGRARRRHHADDPVLRGARAARPRRPAATRAPPALPRGRHHAPAGADPAARRCSA